MMDVKTVDEAKQQFIAMEKQLHRLCKLTFMVHGTSEFDRAFALFQQALLEYTSAARLWGAVEGVEQYRNDAAVRDFESYQEAPAQEEMN